MDSEEDYNKNLFFYNYLHLIPKKSFNIINNYLINKSQIGFERNSGLDFDYKDFQTINSFEDSLADQELGIKRFNSYLINQNSHMNGFFNDFNNIGLNGSRSSARIRNQINSSHYVCDRKGCHKKFTYKTAFDCHLSEHLLKESLDINVDESEAHNSDQMPDGFEDMVEVIEMNGKKRFICKECDLKSNSHKVMSKHIRKDHNNTSHESDCENQLNSLQFAGDMNFQSNSYLFLEPNIRVKMESIENSNVDISFNIDANHVSLSCKGLQSAAKVANHFERRVISGKKTYFCKWNDCHFKTIRTQEIACHINVAHIGLQFKCTQTNCDKVFRSPHAWREHQKNHMCGFGIDGYHRNATGICVNANINTFREKLISKGKRAYRCKWNGCNAVTKYCMAIKRHIHNQHICPFRAKTRFPNSINTVVKTELEHYDQSTQMCTTSTSPVFDCKYSKCGLKFSQVFDLLKHKYINCDYKKSNNMNWIRIKLKKSYRKKMVQIIKRNKLPVKSKLGFTSLKQIQVNTKVITSKSTNNYSNSKKSQVSKRKQILPKAIKHVLNKDYVITKKVKPKKDPKCLQNECDKLEQYYALDYSKGEKTYFCKWKKCEHIENQLIDIINHINETHINFQCNTGDCSKSFHSQELLAIHKSNHICGFSIKGRKPIGVCSADNVKQYRTERVVDGKHLYRCQWNGCDYECEGSRISIHHIHNRHICPNKSGLRDDYNESEDNDRSQGSGVDEIDSNDIIGSYGTELSIKNFVKYSRLEKIKGKRIYVCNYPNCSKSGKNQSLKYLNTKLLKTYSSNLKGNMIRHIRMHCKEKPFVCVFEGCHRRFNCPTSFKTHQTNDH